MRHAEPLTPLSCTVHGQGLVSHVFTFSTSHRACQRCVSVLYGCCTTSITLPCCCNHNRWCCLFHFSSCLTCSASASRPHSETRNVRPQSASALQDLAECQATCLCLAWTGFLVPLPHGPVLPSLGTPPNMPIKRF